MPSSTSCRRRRAEREPCERLRRDAEPTERIREAHTSSGGIHASPRMRTVLARGGVAVGRERVESA
ncbi:hypothetical protein [Streptomyces sp. cmx-4-25]|uniref:hypothetical protein n=1 Tax=Streptomyces sp. cmx-4-25 TaxID=2790933 RepID=UPI0039812685